MSIFPLLLKAIECIVIFGLVPFKPQVIVPQTNENKHENMQMYYICPIYVCLSFHRGNKHLFIIKNDLLLPINFFSDENRDKEFHGK